MHEDIEKLLNSITPDIYGRLKRAVELGKWPNGVALSRNQRDLCIQAIVHWENQNLSPEQRSGYMPPQPHKHCGNKNDEIATGVEQPLKFR